MNAEQIALVQGSFKQVAPIAATAADLFYGRLFEIAPDVRPLFKADLTEQGRKLMAALAVVVSSLDRLDTILPGVRGMAVRHAGYGVEPRHYAIVGEALVWTLDKGLGDAFTPDVREAWETAYTALAGVMIAAAEESEAA